MLMHWVWKLMVYIVFLLQTVSVGRRKFSANFQLVFRLIKGLIFVTFISILVILIALPHMTPRDIVVCILAFMPTGWGLLLVSYISTIPLFSYLQFFCQTYSQEAFLVACFDFTRLLKHVSQLFKELDSGDQSER